MDENKKKLIQLRSELKVYKKIDNKIGQVLHAKLELESFSEEVYNMISRLEEKLDNLKIDMDLPDEDWFEDEN